LDIFEGPLHPGIKNFLAKNKNVTFLHSSHRSFVPNFRKIECAVLEKSTKNYENLTLGFEDRGQKGLIWAIWGSKGGFSDIKTPTGGRIRIFRGYRQLNSRFKH
jgi:hypothetical protein